MKSHTEEGELSCAEHKKFRLSMLCLLLFSSV